ncbi:hypothetical protein CTZ27_33250 [Streptomyces griseocarneus]|nr:hypothetical protein CTZ27_33250 [Streptomyces griseocarneus]
MHCPRSSTCRTTKSCCPTAHPDSSERRHLVAHIPFLDSTRLLHSPTALATRLKRDGYLCLRGVLPSTDVDAVRRHVLAVADDAGWLLPATAAGAVPIADPTAAVWDPDPAYRQVHRRMWTHRPVHALMHHPTLLRVITAAIGTGDVFVHPRKVLRAAHPNPANPASTSLDGGWHQDFPEVQGSPNTLTVWAPLAPVTPDTGALAIAPASHHEGTLPLRLASTAVGWEADVHPSLIHTGPMNPGDILIFTTHTVHRGTPNTGPGLRLSIDARYQPVQEPINETCLELRDETYGWDAVYAHWPTLGDDPLVRYWQQQPLNVVPYDQRYDRWREHTALAAGARREPLARRALEITAQYSQADVAARAGTLLAALPVVKPRARAPHP